MPAGKKVPLKHLLAEGLTILLIMLLSPLSRADSEAIQSRIEISDGAGGMPENRTSPHALGAQQNMKVSNVELFYLKNESDSTHLTGNRQLETVNLHPFPSMCLRQLKLGVTPFSKL